MLHKNSVTDVGLHVYVCRETVLNLADWGGDNIYITDTVADVETMQITWPSEANCLLIESP